MQAPPLTFASQDRRPTPERPIAVGSAERVPLTWTFDPSQGLDLPFHGLLSHFGLDLIMDLDEIVLDTPVRAAARATRLYKDYTARLGSTEQLREVMQYMAGVLKPTLHYAEEAPLVPPEAVFHGRPRG